MLVPLGRHDHRGRLSSYAPGARSAVTLLDADAGNNNGHDKDPASKGGRKDRLMPQDGLETRDWLGRRRRRRLWRRQRGRGGWRRLWRWQRGGGRRRCLQGNRFHHWLNDRLECHARWRELSGQRRKRCRLQAAGGRHSIHGVLHEVDPRLHAEACRANVERDRICPIDAIDHACEVLAQGQLGNVVKVVDRAAKAELGRDE